MDLYSSFTCTIQVLSCTHWLGSSKNPWTHQQPTDGHAEIEINGINMHKRSAAGASPLCV